MINYKCEYYFKNIKSLTLINTQNLLEEFLNDNTQSKIKRLQSLKIIVNLTNVEHLNLKWISNIISPSILLELLKQMPKLSPLNIEKSALISCFNNNELYCYLNKMIKILDITHYNDDGVFMS